MPQGAADEALWQERVTPGAPCFTLANRSVHVPDDVPGAHDQRRQQQPSRGANPAGTTSAVAATSSDPHLMFINLPPSTLARMKF